MTLDDTIRAARAGKVAPEELFGALAEARLLIAGAPNDAGAFLPHLLKWNGRDYAAVFTSPQLTATLPDAPGFAELTGRDLGGTWTAALGALVNPGTDDLTLVFDAGAVRLLAHPERAAEVANNAIPADAGPVDEPRGQPDKLAAGKQVAVGAPAKPPAEEFVAAVRAAVRATPGVEVAYLFQRADAVRGSRLVLGVALMDGEDGVDATMQHFANDIVAAYPPATDTDVIVLGDELRASVAGHVDALD